MGQTNNNNNIFVFLRDISPYKNHRHPDLQLAITGVFKTVIACFYIECDWITEAAASCIYAAVSLFATEQTTGVCDNDSP